MSERNDWFVFQPGNDEASIHPSKALAVRSAQARACLNVKVRPNKITAGHYQIYGCGGHQYWIVSRSVMQSQFPALMKSAYEDAQ